MDAAVDAARWVVGKALAPVIDGLLESWAASAGLGPNIDALKMQLLYAQGMLDSAQGKDIRSGALKELLHKLRELAYGADDVLDELDYFRIQDMLEGTYHAANLEDQGYVDGLVLNVRQTTRAAVSKLKPSSRPRDAGSGDPDDQAEGGKQGCLSLVRPCGTHGVSSSPSSPTRQGVQERKVGSYARNTVHAIGKHFPCSSFPPVQEDDADSDTMETSNMARSGRRFLCGTWTSKMPPRNHVRQTQTQTQMPMKTLKFDRVEISTKMVEIVEQLKPLCAMVSTILSLELLGSCRIPTQDIARSKTTPDIIEPDLYGRDDLKKKIVDGITDGKYCTNELTVVPLVGPGGIGKTTLTQHIYRELEKIESSFQVSAWICVSLDLNADRLLQEIVKQIPKVDGERDNASNHELIEQRLKSKGFLLVLDDVWTYHEDEWDKLLAPLRCNERERGHVVIVTTRIPKVASMVSTDNSPIDVERLSDEHIMDFFQVCVFGDQKSWEDHPELRDVGNKIVVNLKGFPLAAKTVGRLLRNQLTLQHWTSVAESREWELETGPNDIMPALKLSYDYLPFHLQQCFYNCALFPEDYAFGRNELVHFWIGLDIVHSRDQGKRTEDVALSYLNELVNHGFFKKNEKENHPHYVIHDLLHDLAVKVSSYECLSICSSNMRSIQIPASVRHMSIIVDNTDVMDITSFKDYKSYLSALGKTLKVQSLRTLMLFGEYHGSFAKIFRDLFKEARALRTVFLSGASYSVDDLLINFSGLVHLRYLKIKSVLNEDMSLPSALFRSYHLEVIDLENWGGSFVSTSQMSKLIKLRHFLVPKNNDEVHSSIFDVGKLKLLQELRRFEVRKETEGFELVQLGELSELGGSLDICNLEKVQKEDDTDVIKLIHKNHLQKLKLEWNNSGIDRDTKHEDNVLESMVPHKNLQNLSIQGHRGANCPSWLGEYLSVENLVSLTLRDVSWNNLPPLGEMWFVKDLGVEYMGVSSTLSFQCLKGLRLVNIQGLTKWVGNKTCHLFSHLENVSIEDCPNLVEVPFSHPTSMTWFPRLRYLRIKGCPELSSLAPIPWTPAPCTAQVEGVGCDFKKLVYSRDKKELLALEVVGKEGQNGKLWNGLDFHNLGDLEVLMMYECPPLPLVHLQKLKSLKTLKITSKTVLLLFEGEEHSTGFPLPVEHINIRGCDANGVELTRLLSYFPKLKVLGIEGCQKITGLGVVEHQTATETPASLPSSSVKHAQGHVHQLMQRLRLLLPDLKKVKHAQAGDNQQQTRGEDEVVSAAAGLLLLPPQLEELHLWNCRELRLLSASLGNDNARDGLKSLCSLHRLWISGCPWFPSSSALSCFPTSLQSLCLEGVEGMETLDCLSNLTSLDELFVWNCRDLRGPLVAQDCLTQLQVRETPNFFTSLGSSKIVFMLADDLAGVLTLPTCSRLSSSLTRVTFFGDQETERFTEEQEDALHLLNSLQEVKFRSCEKLQRIPAALTKLTNLKKLWVGDCPVIQMLPKDGLPSSLQELVIANCPAIKSLPKESLPSSLLKLEVFGDISEELKSQCRKLKGTIPIIIH